MSAIDRHWGISNPQADALMVWLEPWAEEFTVPPQSTLTMMITTTSGSIGGNLDVEQEDGRIIIWAESGQLVQVYIDGQPIRSASAQIAFPGAEGMSTKNFLTIMLQGQPQARLGGEAYTYETRPSLGQKIRRWLGL